MVNNLKCFKRKLNPVNIMAKFAKIIEIKEEQVLFTVNYNSEDDVHELVIRTDIGDVAAEIRIGRSSAKKAMEALNGYTYERAVNLEVIWKSCFLKKITTNVPSLCVSGDLKKTDFQINN